MEIGYEVWYKNILYKDARDELWLPGVVQSKSVDEEGNDVLIIRNSKLGDASIRCSKDSNNVFLKNPFTNGNDSSLSNLAYLNEPEILHHLKERYKKDEMCTYLGPILVSVNPYHENPGESSYNIQSLNESGTWSVNGGTGSIKIHDLAHSAFKKIRECLAEEEDLDKPASATGAGSAAGKGGGGGGGGRHHSILISGESGSGKSECCKLLLRCLIDDTVASPSTESGPESPTKSDTDTSRARTPSHGPTVSLSAVNRKNSRRFSFSKVGLAGIVNKIGLASLVLEAFGNAKTLLNDHSTRFGLYTQMDYNDTGLLIGGELHTYLLEWNRLHTQQLGERNFHIFYQLVAGASEQEKAQWHVGNLKDFQILNQGRASIVSHIDDAGDFLTLKEHLEDLEFDEAIVSALMRAVSSVLHLGQVQFKSTFDNNGEGCAMVDMELFEKICGLCGVPAKDFESLLLLRNSLVIRGESFDRKMTTAHAINARHAISVAVYKRLFIWLVHALNAKIAPKSTSGKVEATVGILDIFGFRCLDMNYFDELCVNYASEALQQHMSHQIFKIEGAFLRSEGISFDANTKIFDVSSKQVLELISGDIFAILDEHCSLPDSTDNKYAKQIYAKCENKPGFTSTELHKTDKSFVIRHYAAQVVYTMRGFIEKNMDELPVKFNAVFDKSTNVVLGHIPLSSKLSMDKMKATPRRQSYYQAQQVVHAFKEQLSSLVEKVQATDSQFIRCIKPTDTVYHRNSQKKASLAAAVATAVAEKEAHAFNDQFVCEQLKFGGVIEAARVARVEYVAHVRHIEFYARYRLLITSQPGTVMSELPDLSVSGDHDPALVLKSTQRLAELLRADSRITTKITSIGKKLVPKLPVGKTFVFLTHADHSALESVLTKVMVKAIMTVHNFCGCFIMRKWFCKVQKHYPIIQRNVRAFVHRRRYIKLRKAVISLQRKFRQVKLLVSLFGTYGNFRNRIVRFQALFRRHRCQQRLKKQARVRALIKSREEDLKTALGIRLRRRYGVLDNAKISHSTKSIDFKPHATEEDREVLSVPQQLERIRTLDAELKGKIEAMVKALKPLGDIVDRVLFDVALSKKLLVRWAGIVQEANLSLIVERIVRRLDFGHNLLKAKKLLPQTMMKKMFTGKADSSQLAVDGAHPLFNNVLDQIQDLKLFIQGCATIKTAREASIPTLNASLGAAAGNKTKEAEITSQLKKAKRHLGILANMDQFGRYLLQYHSDYIAFVVREYGTGSKYQKGFKDNSSYLNAFHNLILQGKPLNAEEELYLKTKTTKMTADPKQQSLAAMGGVFQLPNDDISRIMTSYGLYFKYMPYAPGIEFTTNCVLSLLTKQVQPPTRVIRVKGVSSQSHRTAYFQAAVEYSNISLRDLFTTPKSIEFLEFDSLSATMLMSMVMGCSIVQPANVMVQPNKDFGGVVKSVKVLGITNTFGFTEGVFDYYSMSSAATTALFKKYGYNKYLTGSTNNNLNVLYFLPQMDEPVDPTVRELFTHSASAPEQFVAEWLHLLYERNKSYEALSKVGYTEADFKALKLPIHLPKRVAVSVYRRLRVINSLFHPLKNHVLDPNPPRITHQDILSAFCPYASKYYKAQRRSFELPEFAGLVPYHAIYTETLRELTVAKKARRASVLKAKTRSSFVAGLTHSGSSGALTPTRAAASQRASVTSPLSPQSPLPEDIDERPKSDFAGLSTKFAQVYGSASSKARFVEQHGDGLEYGFGLDESEERDLNHDNAARGILSPERRRANNDDEEEDEEETEAPPTPSEDFNYNVYNDLDTANYDPETMGQESYEEMLQVQSPSGKHGQQQQQQKEEHQLIETLSFDMYDAYGKQSMDNFDFTHAASRYEPNPVSKEQQEQEGVSPDDLDLQTLQMEGSFDEMSEKSPRFMMSPRFQTIADVHGDKFSFGPTVLPSDPEEVDALYNTSIEDVAVEFLKHIDFDRLSREKNHAVCNTLIDTLYFIPKIVLCRVSEEQLKVIFNKYLKQGPARESMKAKPVVSPVASSAPVHASTAGMEDNSDRETVQWIEPLKAKEVVIVHNDEAVLDHLKHCSVVSQLERVLGMRVTTVLE